MAETIRHVHYWQGKTYQFRPDAFLRLNIKNVKINFYKSQVFSGYGISSNPIYFGLSLPMPRRYGLRSTGSTDDARGTLYSNAFAGSRKPYTLVQLYNFMF